MSLLTRGAASPQLGPTPRHVLALLLAAFAPACLAHHPEPIPAAAAPAYPTRVVTVDGVGLRIRDERPPSPRSTILLLHGFGSSLDTWARVVPRLAEHHRVVAVDLKGFGHSARPPGDYSPPAQAALLVGLMDTLGIEQAAIGAHSWGSSVALALALAAPHRVSRLALYGAWIYDEQIPPYFRWAMAPGLGEALFSITFRERPGERLQRAFYDPDLIEERYLERVVADLERPGTLAASLATVRGMDLVTLARRYREVTVPTLLLWGREDRVSPPHFGERLARELADAELVVYPRCGHFPHVEAFEPSTRALLDFLAGGRR